MKTQKMNDQEFLSDEDFVSQRDRYDNQIAVKQLALNEAKIDEFDIQSALDYCLQSIKQLARQWFDMALEQKQRFQKLVLSGVFPMTEKKDLEPPNCRLFMR